MLLGWLAMQEGGGKTHESQAMHALDVTTISRFVHCIDPSAGMGWGMRGEGGGGRDGAATTTAEVFATTAALHNIKSVQNCNCHF